MNLYERFPAGREVRVRFGSDWRRGRVVEVRWQAVVVNVDGTDIHIHKSVIRRDVRVGKR